MNVLATMDIMSVFDFILFAYGGYTIYSAVKMRKSGVPSKWLVPEEEIKKCKDVKGFIDAMYGKTILFGAAALLYGVISTVNRFYLSLFAVELVCIIVFLGMCALYIMFLSRARKQFF